ncbi:hypothetical protein J5X84_08245 [Streptosporangiaceae bacterium NEAU-GS5]|nr:hypothetical protein [Streptosporangiaceae bacterium NEAU-GS5]
MLIDPDSPHGRIIVEFHAYRNRSTLSRMHLELTRERNERWYAYWVEQFTYLWEAAAKPELRRAPAEF